MNRVPTTLADPLSRLSQAMIDWRERSIGVPDDQRLFAALRGIAP